MEALMRIMLLTAGSRGDVQPFVALARRAQREGHDVRLAVTREFLSRASAAGIDAAPLDADFETLVAAQGVSPLAALRSYRSTVAPMMATLLRSAARAVIEYRPDVVVHHPKVLPAGLAAVRLDVPRVLCEIVSTMTPTAAFPAAGVTTIDLGRLNPLTYRVASSAAAAFAGPLRDVRSDLGLPRRGAVPGPVRSAVPVSPELLPRPAGWPVTTVLTGPWLDAAPHSDGHVDDEVRMFLDAGEVLYAGFGSMAAGDPIARGRAVVTAARRAGLRTLITTGWGGIEVPDDLRGDDVLLRRSVPHDEVLPRCVAAVHHGGAGTVHAVVRAGLPAVVVPFLADQPFWGALLHRRGLAAAPVAARRCTADRLLTALSEMPDRAAVEPCRPAHGRGGRMRGNAVPAREPVVSHPPADSSLGSREPGITIVQRLVVLRGREPRQTVAATFSSAVTVVAVPASRVICAPSRAAVAWIVGSSTAVRNACASSSAVSRRWGRGAGPRPRACTRRPQNGWSATNGHTT
jgi:sterol 3beta-glucosyltransferase